MIKICHLTSVHPRNDVRVFKECKSLASNYDVSLIVADNNGFEEKDNVKIHDVGTASGRLSRMLFTTKKVYKKAIKLNCEIVHFHDPELLFVGLLLKRKGKKVIFDVHEDVSKQISYKYYINKNIRKTLSFLYQLIEKFASKKFDHIITTTQAIYQIFSNDNKTVINNYPVFHLNSESTPFKAKKDEIIYSGLIGEVRNIRGIIEALSLTDTRLNLAGKFETNKLRDEIIAMKGWSQVNEFGFVRRAVVNDLLSISKIGLIINKPIEAAINSQPNKMFEYMNAGLPVVASNFPLWKEIVEKYDCGICVDPLDPKEISEAIIYLLNNNDVAERMGQNGKKVVENHFNWSNEEKKIQTIYKNLL